MVVGLVPRHGSPIKACSPFAIFLLVRLHTVASLTDIACTSSNSSHCPKYDLDFFDQFNDEGVGCCLAQDSSDSYCGTEDECADFYEQMGAGLLIFMMFQSSCCLCCILFITVACCFPRSGQKGAVAPAYANQGAAGQTFSRTDPYGEVREDTIPLTQGEYEEGQGLYQPIY
mmetsp:Transcript_28609/g.52039  ORF Transcript_28609/g.52039 Transcript_28609/m.52039 type:complete len:172 (-) Transcript_28609:186-701(-)